MRIAVAVALLPAALIAAPIHYQPMRPQGSGMIERYSIAAAPANAWLDYYGGHVISNVHVVPVMWGANVPSDVQTTMPQFYAAVTNSTFWDFLAEYDTNILDFAGSQGTNQHIGRGTASKAIVITPSITSTTITNDQIWQELQRQITAGNLPQPDANTLYMVHFPAGLSITMPDGNGGTAASCQQFCAYHNTTTAAGSIPEFYYGVIPNVTTDGCELGCGPVGGGINNTTSVASHELIEATTDAEVGLATNNAPPLAWYDPQGQDGEIGDICNGSQGTISAGGQSWTVQQEWSNNHNACITGPDSNDFALEVSPGNRAIAAGSSATFTVVSKVIAGTPGTISLSSGSMPAGLTATISPSQNLARPERHGDGLGQLQRHQRRQLLGHPGQRRQRAADREGPRQRLGRPGRRRRRRQLPGRHHRPRRRVRPDGLQLERGGVRLGRGVRGGGVPALAAQAPRVGAHPLFSSGAAQQCAAPFRARARPRFRGGESCWCGSKCTCTSASTSTRTNIGHENEDEHEHLSSRSGP